LKNTPHQVEYGQSIINFSLQFSDRKTVAISVHPDCQVIVAAPNDADLSKVQELVHKRARWIQKQQQYFQQFLPRTPSRSYVSGETHLYLGRQYRIKLATEDKPLLKLSGGHLIIHHPDPSLADNVEAVLYNWYRQRAEQKFRERFKLCLSKFPAKPSIVMPENQELHIRKMKSRWGSYAPSGRLTLNLELIKAPTECIDYVIAHELCHAVYPHHGPKFYRLLETVMPDYSTRKAKLELTLS
jgi:predicted metal-dependent hydrolase